MAGTDLHVCNVVVVVVVVVVVALVVSAACSGSGSVVATSDVLSYDEP